ncbi:TraR/DksA family transcriptional regulator [Silvanigrella sp.]|jgi:DnaK suppressor protein|uniref:TraR/DksA family transcriptional regulator n=1 Tax=Silvanigrella sp. TaxID=2024976 RepID=UPI0037C73643
MPPKMPSQPQELTRAEVSQLKTLLTKLRDELYAKEVARKNEGAYEISRDDISDETDLASVETDQEVNMKLAEADRVKIALIEKALRKIEANDGTYGLCEGTGDPIGFKRLQIQPWVLYSLRHQEDLERGRRAN